MLVTARYALLILFFSSITAQACSWQMESKLWMGTVDSSRAVIKLGQPKGGIAYHIKDTDEGRFRACIEAFAQHFSFKPIYARSPTWPDGRSFVDIWYLRDDGAAFNVTDITMAEKFRVLFYGQKDGKGSASARSAFSSFENGTTDFERVEVYPEVPD